MDNQALKEIKINANGIEFESKGYVASEVIEILSLLTGAACNNTFNLNKVEKISSVAEQIKSQPTSDIEVFDAKELMGEVKLPRLTSNFRCPSCSQTMLLIDKRNKTILIKDIKDNKLHSVSVDLDSFPVIEYDKENGADYKAVVTILNDLISNHNNDDITLVSDSDDNMVCPICKLESELKDFIKEYDSNLTFDDCPVCGGPIDRVITKEGQKVQCLNNNCLSVLDA